MRALYRSSMGSRTPLGPILKGKHVIVEGRLARTAPEKPGVEVEELRLGD